MRQWINLRKALTYQWSLAVCALSLSLTAGWSRESPAVHAVSDVAHEFTFYADGRFHKQYLPGQPVVMSWGSLFNFDFSNANLLVLLGCDPRLQYSAEDIHTITNFLEQGGGVVLFGADGREPQEALARVLGCEFGGAAKLPLKAAGPEIKGKIEGGGSTLELREPTLWEVLATDGENRPILARRAYGKGTLLVSARGLAGQNPNASDDINASWWQPLLVKTASGKVVDPEKPFRSRGITELEYTDDLGVLKLRYSDYLKPYAKAMADIYLRCRPVIEKRMGVPLSKGMASEIGLLATGGGGFSSGRMLGLAVFWGDFPAREDSMIEFITHESVHSWVLPFPEIWNEPIATYMGNLVMMDMGHEAEANKRIEQTIQRAARLDPTMKVYDLNGKGPEGARQLRGGEANDIHWGKTYWILEQLRKENPQVIADYFKAKRRLASPERIKEYDAHATVALLSIVMKRDLFPWFREHGLHVEATRSPIPVDL